MFMKKAIALRLMPLVQVDTLILIQSHTACPEAAQIMLEICQILNLTPMAMQFIRQR